MYWGNIYFVINEIVCNSYIKLKQKFNSIIHVLINAKMISVNLDKNVFNVKINYSDFTKFNSNIMNNPKRLFIISKVNQ